ncbi:LXG domain-containing protein [Fictibacillus sp. 5RED26]|uniref:ribonuclease YeeF family protein n=1 Tax=Fictibacillus sp. 5RED26 TaxID=2745876 RepID=UPI0018CEB8E6|nr:LXG domain-containing protein [Fictibacillus sp. 5RED26]MBH0156686.1 LXG domain-containing protein [Fictibacillus sp. 5RED26]
MGSKVYEASTLKAATRERAQQYVRLKEQFETLKKEFIKIVDNTEFRGHGAEAIKGFYQGQIDVVDAWILFIDMNVEFFNEIPGDMADVDLSEDTVVQVPFLENSVEPAGKMAKEIVTDQQDALQRIFNGIADLVPLTVFSKDAFDSYMDQAEKKRVQTVDKVNELDNRLLQEYASSQTQEQHIFALYSQLLEATRQGEDISPLYFDAEAYHTSKAYQVHAESIGTATTSVKQGENGKAPQIEIKNNELQNPGDVAVVKTIEVFDEIEGKTNGTYFLYENGQIIWKHPAQTGKVVYKEVDEVPESRVGGVEELDSAFDGTGLAFLGWLHPKDVLKKSVKLVIKRGGKTTVKKLSKKEIKEVSAKRFVYDKKTGTWVDKNGKPLGKIKSTNKDVKNYRKTFFDKYPELEGSVVVHHAIEQQILKKHPNLFTLEEIHALRNLRGIPKEVNSDIHLSKIRKDWNRFYRNHPNPTKEEVIKYMIELDKKYGDKFNPPVKR